VSAQFYRMFQPDSGGEYDAEFRIFRADNGEERWVHAKGRAYFAPKGIAVRSAGTLMDITDRKRAEQALRRSEERVRLAQEAGRIGHWEWDLRTDRAHLSASQMHLLGQEPREMEGPAADFLSMIHPEDQERAQAAITAAKQGAGPLDTEFRIVLPSGEVRWIASRGELIRDETGEPARLIGINFDVSERREAEERQRLLMAEVDHRAKNMLTVVLAMLRLTRADDMPSYIRTVEGRVGALARAHTLLAKNRWAGVELKCLITDEMLAFTNDAARVELLGPTIHVVPDAAQSVAMVFHELATNAAKYGALSMPSGQVRVSWERKPDGGLHLRWAEIGGPPVEAPRHRGFGSTLIEQCIRHQLDGTVRMGWYPDGLRAEIDLPPARLLEGRPGSEAQLSNDNGQAVPAGNLEGLRVLVAEDEALVALEIRGVLDKLGCIVVGPVSSLDEALHAARGETLDAALLDVNLKGERVFAAADALSKRGIPYLFCTGYGREAGMDLRHRHAVVIRKPFRAEDLAEGLRRILVQAPAAGMKEAAYP